MIVHWDGEEQGLMGSYEFVEEHGKELAERAVAYINLDVAVRGMLQCRIRVDRLIGCMTSITFASLLDVFINQKLKA